MLSYLSAQSWTLFQTKNRCFPRHLREVIQKLVESLATLKNNPAELEKGTRVPQITEVPPKAIRSLTIISLVTGMAAILSDCRYPEFYSNRQESYFLRRFPFRTGSASITAN